MDQDDRFHHVVPRKGVILQQSAAAERDAEWEDALHFIGLRPGADDHPKSTRLLDRDRHIRGHLGELRAPGLHLRGTPGVHVALDPEQLLAVVVFHQHADDHGLVRFIPTDAHPRGHREADLSRYLGHTVRVPAAAHDVELASDDLRVVGYDCVLDIHGPMVADGHSAGVPGHPALLFYRPRASYSPGMAQYGEPGERIGYEVHAHPDGAPPLLLLHGFTASSASFATNLASLRERFTVVTVDLLGHGASDAPADPHAYTPDHAVERIIGLMDKLDFDRALLCGHSLGGAVALRVALDYPERVAGLVVINSNSAAGSPRWREDVQPRLEEMARRLRAEGTGFLKESRLYPARSSRLPADAKAMLKSDFERLDANGVAGTAEGLIARINAFERLPELAVPTLLVIGDRDQEFVNNAPRMIANIRRNVVQMVTLEDAGHAANLEQPEGFRSALIAFSEDIGYLHEEKAAGRKRMLLVFVGGSLLTAALAFLAAAFVISQKNDNEPTNTGVSTVTPTPKGQAAATRPRTTGTAASASAVLPATPPPAAAGAASVTGTATVAVATPTNRPPVATPTPVTNQPTPTPVPPTATPATATATATPVTPTPTATPPGGRSLSVGVNPGTGLTRTFFATASGPQPLRIDWSQGSPSQGFSTTVTFPGPGTYTVTATATYLTGTAVSGSTMVTVP